MITKEVFSEIYDIICHTDKELYNKIPINFIKFIEQNRDYKYISTIDYSKSINKQS